MNYEDLYKAAAGESCEMVKRSHGIALGFHSVADGLILTEERKFQKMLEDFRVNPSEPPQSISSVEDFLAGYLFTFSTGKALQLMIDKEDVKKWIEEHFGKGQLRLGGTSANMAVALASFGFSKVLVYVYPLVKELADLFPDLPNLRTVSNKGKIIHPRSGWNGEKLGAIHWIFEVKKGQKISLSGREIICPRDNRFIASWNPVNSKLDIASYFRKIYMGMVSQYPKFLLAGFHIMRDTYPDGDTVENRMREIVSFVREIKGKGATVHVEMASVRRERVRKAMIDLLFPEIDSLGLNEVELSWIAEDIGISSTGIMDGEEDKVLRALEVLRDKKGIKRIHFHTLGYYMLVREKANREALNLAVAALAAARRAETGKPPSCNEIKSAMIHPMSEFGIKASRIFKEDAFILPTRIVDRPKITVGLGDTISSIAFSLSDLHNDV